VNLEAVGLVLGASHRDVDLENSVSEHRLRLLGVRALG
jgi:hypothetical protein